MDKREQILEATADLIAEQGLQDCPMAKVARHAGCGAGTIYRYFSTKEELVQQLYLHLNEKMAYHCLPGLSEAECIRKRFDHFWGSFYQFLRAHPREVCLFDQLWASPVICSELREQGMHTMHEEITRLLDSGKQAGLIKPLADELLLTMTFGSLFTLLKKQLQKPEMFTEPVQLQDLLNMCWDAICVHQP